MSEDNASMNEDLKKWFKAQKNNIKDGTESEASSKKSPSGNCELCGEKKAITVCIKCGRNVCKSCHFKLVNVCKKCIPSEVAGKWDGTRKDWEKELGVEWIE